MGYHVLLVEKINDSALFEDVLDFDLVVATVCLPVCIGALLSF